MYSALYAFSLCTVKKIGGGGAQVLKISPKGRGCGIIMFAKGGPRPSLDIFTT